MTKVKKENVKIFNELSEKEILDSISEDYLNSNEDNLKFYNHIENEENLKKLNKIFDSVKNPVKDEESLDETISYDKAKLEAVEQKERRLLDERVIKTFEKNAEIDRKLKEKYAGKLMGAFLTQLILFNLILMFVGLGWLDYQLSTLNLFVTGGLIEVIALIKIIVSYLFKDNITTPLTNILEKNKINK